MPPSLPFSGRVQQKTDSDPPHRGPRSYRLARQRGSAKACHHSGDVCPVCLRLVHALAPATFRATVAECVSRAQTLAIIPVKHALLAHKYLARVVRRGKPRSCGWECSTKKQEGEQAPVRSLCSYEFLLTDKVLS